VRDEEERDRKRKIENEKVDKKLLKIEERE